MKKYFIGISKLEDLKNEYRRLAKQFHPDINPNGLEEMKAINTAFENLFEILKKDDKKAQAQNEQADCFMSRINALIDIEAIKIEIIGNWVWVSGNTFAYKDRIKKAGFKWSKNKNAWYWHPEGYIKRDKKVWKLNEIRNAFGYEVIKEQEANKAVN